MRHCTHRFEGIRQGYEMSDNAVCTAVCTASNVFTAEGLTPSSPTGMRSQSNGQCSPAHGILHQVSPATKDNEVLSTPSAAEKRAHLNGLPSPSRLLSGNTNNHTGKQYLEGYLRTDDRMRLAKERREERDKGLAVREQVIREKERRAQLQYERTVEERWRRLEEQRQKEELRRAAVEEKRRQKLEEEKERLEALMKRSLERSLQLDQRPKRWTWGGPGGAPGDCENAPPPASAFPHDLAAPFPAASESAPCSPHRSPYRGSPSRTDRRRLQSSPEESAGGSASTPQTPKKESLRRERRTGSPATLSPVRRAESPAGFTRRSASPATPKLLPKTRTQSPCAVRQYPSSPVSHRHIAPVTDDLKVGKVEEDNGHNNDKDRIVSKPGTPVVKKIPDIQSPKKSLQIDAHQDKLSTLNKRFHNVENSNGQTSENMTSEKSSTDKMKSNSMDLNSNKSTEPSPGTPTGKTVAGTTNAEEASRLLAERRRLARVQKELEEKQRQDQEKDKRLKAEQLTRKHAKERARQAEEERSRQEDLRREREEQEKRRREGQEKVLQVQFDREKEEAESQAHKNDERQRQEREILKLQEEEERQLRKKRIEEIMKRTRKSQENQEEMKKVEGLVDTQPVSPPGAIEAKTIESNTQVNKQRIPKVESQVIGHVTTHVSMENRALVKASDLVTTKNVLEKRQDVKVGGACGAQNPKLESAFVKKQVPSQVTDQEGAQVNVKTTDQINAPDNPERLDVSELSNQDRDSPERATKQEQVSGHHVAQLKTQESLQVNVKVMGRGTLPSKLSLAPLAVGQPPPPVIHLEPLDVGNSRACDEVQSMEVSPVSREELISIPEFSPINEVQHNGMSNARALEDLLDLTGHVTFPKLSPLGQGDCNQNLIQGLCSPESTLIHAHLSLSHKLNIQ
ncbi:hypothetical protein DPEC_G00239990 [Dallia pectoralis]|uniref:Uncharacterized protein n=1 Tax=Dallia pectoralis TaxID=75939 RepID=A0ACC2FZM1_DALPE|nr:hypothetical protein DPEC_G00239990 [Dallia pectoralis]